MEVCKDITKIIPEIHNAVKTYKRHPAKGHTSEYTQLINIDPSGMDFVKETFLQLGKPCLNALPFIQGA